MKLFLKLALVGAISTTSLQYTVGASVGTNYSNDSNYEQVATACSINSISAVSQSSCEPATNTFTQEIEVTYTNAPATGNLSVNGQTFSITGSPQIVTLSGLISDGQPVDVTASFTDSTDCFLTVQNLFTAPEECVICTINDLEAGFQTGCDPATNTYTQEVTVHYTNEPFSGSLDVNGQLFAVTGSPQTVTLTGLVANGLEVAVTARFTADTVCSYTELGLFVSPEECFEECSIMALLAGAQSSCNPGSGTYSQQVVVVYEHPPASGTLDVNGQSFPIVGSPQTVVLLGLEANGDPVDVNASFSEDTECTLTEPSLFTAPTDCAPNAIPIAENDTVSVAPETSVTIELTSNDIDMDGELMPESVLVINLPSNGRIELNPDGTVTYIPNAGFTGTDSFTYTVEDDEGQASNLGTVIVYVELLTDLNDSPYQADQPDIYLQYNDVVIDFNQLTTSSLYISVSDLYGRHIYQQSLSQPVTNQYRVNIPQANAASILLVRIKTDQGYLSKKLVSGRR